MSSAFSTPPIVTGPDDMRTNTSPSQQRIRRCFHGTPIAMLKLTSCWVALAVVLGIVGREVVTGKTDIRFSATRKHSHISSDDQGHDKVEELMVWTDEAPDNNSTTYSVIVLATNPHPSNQFRDKKRVKAYTPAGSAVISVQYARPAVTSVLGDESHEEPFFVSYARGADKRVRIFFMPGQVDEPQVCNIHYVFHDEGPETLPALTNH